LLVRGEQRRRYGSLYDDLVSLLFRHDPISLDHETNTDEYAPEVGALLPRLEGCTSVEDVAVALHRVFVDYFDAKLAGPKSLYDRIAPDVWDLWEMRRKPRP
jgi:hypothetical protein